MSRFARATRVHHPLASRLRTARVLRGLSQREAGRRSGVGEKSISSFETGDRVQAMKVSQLERILKVYGVPLDRFFADTPFGNLAEEARAELDVREFVGEELPAILKIDRILERFDPVRAGLMLEFIRTQLMVGPRAEVRRELHKESPTN